MRSRQAAHSTCRFGGAAPVPARGKLVIRSLYVPVQRDGIKSEIAGKRFTRRRKKSIMEAEKNEEKNEQKNEEKDEQKNEEKNEKEGRTES